MTKPKLDLAAFKPWLIEHGEKLGFGLAVVVLCWLTFKAIRRETLDASKSPDSLKEAVLLADQAITNSPFDPQASELAVVDYTTRTKWDPIDSKNFQLPVPFALSIVDPKGKRPQPVLYTVERLQVHADTAPFGVTEATPGAGGPPTGPTAPYPAGARKK